MGSPAASARAPRLAALCVRTLPELRPGGRRLNVQAATDAGKLKSIDELPGPSLSTTLYWLFVRGYADKSHLLQVPSDATLQRFTVVLSQPSLTRFCRTGEQKLPSWQETPHRSAAADSEFNVCFCVL